MKDAEEEVRMEHPPYWAAEAVSAFLREQANWREAQAQRFPDDYRNLRSASALAQLATVVEQLTDDHLALSELVRLEAFDERRRFIANEEHRRATARYGYDRTSTPGALIQELVAITRRARRSAHEKESRMTTRTIPEVPKLPTVLWVVADAAARRMWHAVKDELAGDRVLTYCGKRLELGGATMDVRQNLAPFPGCPACEVALQRLSSDDNEQGFTAVRVSTDHRGGEIATTLANCFEHDREIRRLNRYMNIALSNQPGARDVVVEHPARVLDVGVEYLAICSQLASLLIGPVTALVDQALDFNEEWRFLDWPTEKQTQRIRALFGAAGIDDRFEAAGLEDGIEEQTGAVPLNLRRAIARELEHAKNAIRLLALPPTNEQITAVEQPLRNARDNAEPVRAYAARIDEALERVSSLPHVRTGGDLLELRGDVYGAIDSIMYNLLPEDLLDAGTPHDRARALHDMLREANAGEAWAVEILKARPQIAFVDELTKRWVEQVDSGPRSPGISAQRDRITRTRPPEE